MVFKPVRTLLLASVLGSVAVLALAPGLVSAQGTPAPAANANTPAGAEQQADPVVARVNGKEVKRSEVLAIMETLPPQVQQLPMNMIYTALLDQAVNARLVQDAGYKQKLQDSAEVKEQMKWAEGQFVQQAYMRKAIEGRLTDDLVKKRYDEWVKENPPQDEVRARHILVKTKEEADALIKQLKGGADFAKLAAEKGTDGTAQQGGDLGYFVADEMVEPFSKAAFAMKPGDVSATPVETQFGFHVIKLEDKRKRQPPTFEQAAPQLRQLVAQEIREEVFQGLRKDARIETFNIDGTAMPAPAPAAAAPGAAAPKN